MKKRGKTGLSRLIEATGHSIRGIKACWQHETAFRLDVLLCLILSALSFFVAESATQWLALIAPLFLLLIVELLNSAVEVTVDRIGREHNEMSGRAKDSSSAAVMLCLFLIATAWSAIVWTNFT
ncbi:MAG: diacylglycerol kinase [Proteobacteria bacterium]|nr:diacylglycerol kinase [Pseudomonadota bacterium]